MSHIYKKTTIGDMSINTKEFPYYPYIPIKAISDKQKKNMEQHKISQMNTITDPIKSLPKDGNTYMNKSATSHKCINDTTDTTDTTDTSNTSDIEDKLIDFNQEIHEKLEKINKMQKKFNQETKEKLESLYKMEEAVNQRVQEKLERLNSMQETISTNEHIIQEQIKIIDTNKKTADINIGHINQQIVSYNHNTAVLTSQCNQMNDLNSKIHYLNQSLVGLHIQITEAQKELENLNVQIEESKTQLGYHSTMLNSFNIMMQNPQYFMQMLEMASGYLQQENNS